LRIVRNRGRAIVPQLFSADLCRLIIADAEKCYVRIIGEPQPKKGSNSLHFDGLAASGFRQITLNVIAKFTETVAFKVYQRAFGPRVCFPLQHCIFRYQRPDYGTSWLPYHQDVSPDRPGCHFFNTWITLDPCGGDRPGLEILDAHVTRFRRDVYDAGVHFRVIDLTVDSAAATEKLNRLVDASSVQRPRSPSSIRGRDDLRLSRAAPDVVRADHDQAAHERRDQRLQSSRLRPRLGKFRPHRYRARWRSDPAVSHEP
jgi:hypothetical protein